MRHACPFSMHVRLLFEIPAQQDFWNRGSFDKTFQNTRDTICLNTHYRFPTIDACTKFSLTLPQCVQKMSRTENIPQTKSPIFLPKPKLDHRRPIPLLSDVRDFTASGRGGISEATGSMTQTLNLTPMRNL